MTLLCEGALCRHAEFRWLNQITSKIDDLLFALSGDVVKFRDQLSILLWREASKLVKEGFRDRIVDLEFLNFTRLDLVLDVLDGQAMLALLKFEEVSHFERRDYDREGIGSFDSDIDDRVDVMCLAAHEGFLLRSTHPNQFLFFVADALDKVRSIKWLSCVVLGAERHICEFRPSSVVEVRDGVSRCKAELWQLILLGLVLLRVHELPLVTGAVFVEVDQAFGFGLVWDDRNWLLCPLFHYEEAGRVGAREALDQLSINVCQQIDEIVDYGFSIWAKMIHSHIFTTID